MQTLGKDYYDIPDDELPSANFAARPVSEISELGLLFDGLWTLMGITYSLEDTDGEGNVEDDPTPVAHTPDTPKMLQPEMPRTPPATPAITVTSPSKRQSLRQHLRRYSDVAAMVRISSSRQTSDTAPPDSFTSTQYAPQAPRRAMSARLEKRDAALGRHSMHMSFESDLKARRVLGIGETVMEEERPRQTVAYTESEDLRGRLLDLEQTNASFSRKPRVREALKKKQLTKLRMDVVTPGSDQFVDSPQSMTATPVELYSAHKPQPLPQPGRFRPTSAIHGRRGTSTPVSPKTPSAFWRPQPPSSDVLAGNEDLGDAYETRMYVPGPICLEKHPAMLRKDSAATLDPFASETDPAVRRPSDLLALDQTVVFFDGMGLIEEATDECLDRYWLRTPQQALQETDLDVLELDPVSPRSQQSSHSRATSSTLSRFSFSSASSGASVPQDSPQKRQLIRLRRLLSPALPGFKGNEG
jgi:hypothetical protein